MTEPKKRTPVQHAFQASTESKNVGSDHGRAVLNEQIVTWARQLVRRGMPVSDLANAFQVSVSVMSRAVRGQTWSHVREPAVDDVGRLSNLTMKSIKPKKKKAAE